MVRFLCCAFGVGLAGPLFVCCLAKKSPAGAGLSWMEINEYPLMLDGTPRPVNGGASRMPNVRFTPNRCYEAEGSGFKLLRLFHRR